jgi:hypothetical protein
VISEKHYTPKELAERFGRSAGWVIKVFGAEKGVVKIAPAHRRGTRAKYTYLIPESVVERVFDRHRNK